MATNFAMSRMIDKVIQTLHRAPAKSGHILPKFAMTSNNNTRQGNLLRVWLRSPWDDYQPVAPITSMGCLLACRKGDYFVKVRVGVYEEDDTVQFLQSLSMIQHTNISRILDVYCDENKLFIASEYLELSLVDIDFHMFEFDEWEVATIIREVLKGSEYLLRQGISCKDLSMLNVHLSINGDVRIALNFKQYTHKRKHSNLNLLHSFLDLPFLAEIVEDMMLPRYHLIEEKDAWSDEALQFLSCCISGSIESMLKHPFLQQAISPSKLAPRVRFAMEVLRLQGIKQ
ncbi:hypothetical protein BTUL_0306g00120 [Botrytis tulipae]|uniref:Protein kinase domain-containing protein n=1 Tax=Botrytis tulipae TaxID=87230 RepID=A0A4Z1E9K1_9HELO|nr:hypothetical protein BTUL_0306g00120 [Botrytis tulipae]